MGDDSRERTRDLAVAGHVNVDRRLRIPRFPGPDRTVPVSSVRNELGGTAANLALVAARHGVSVGLLSRVGDGFPEEHRRQLERAGIDLGGLRRVRGRSTPTCYILEDSQGAQRTLIDQGPMAEAGPYPVPRRWLRRYSWLHVSTGPPAFQLRLAEFARRDGLRVAADPAQEIFYRWTPSGLRRLLSLSEILFGNRAEIAHAALLTGRSGASDLTELVPSVIRTEGSNGASAFTRVGTVHAPGKGPRSVRSIVGAGDAFRGGFYAAYFSGEILARALAAGNRTAANWIEGRR
jgi:sugar/nucleoside kinase (ribokinase family)